MKDNPKYPWYWAHVEAQRARAREYAAAHRVERRADSRARYWSDPERGRAEQHEYYRANAPSIKVKARQYHKLHYTGAWYQANRERILAAHKEYKRTHHEVGRRATARHNSLKKGVLCTLTASEWAEIQAKYEFACCYCGVKPEGLEQDHVLPLSKGGTHTANNVVPACRSCNAHKGARLLSESVFNRGDTAQ